MARQRDGLRRFFGERVDASSLAVLRMVFGTLMLWATVRFAAHGWIDELYVAPRFHFTYYGFSWVHPWPARLLYAHFVLLGVASLLVALGVLYRVAIVLFTLLFVYVELLDVATYLNHYYAITLVAVLLCFLPAANVLSLDALRARRRGAPKPATVPRAAVALLRIQLGIVYFFAGVAKLQADWLLRAEPLTTWLSARTDAPLVGPLLALPGVPLGMSWAGALFDLTIPLWLSLRRTRAAGYAAVVVFHAVTAQLFQIGMFPWVMIGLTPIFFEPDWPRRLYRRLRRQAPPSGAIPNRQAKQTKPIGRLTWSAMVVWLSVQLLLPLRHFIYPGNVLATEEGFRWSWHVMVAERGGVATFRVVDDGGRTHEVSPSRELTPLQARMMATQPDLILAYAHHLRDEYARRGEHVRVYADVFVSTNGRPARRLIDPEADLASRRDTLWGFYPWVLHE